MSSRPAPSAAKGQQAPNARQQQQQQQQQQEHNYDTDDDGEPDDVDSPDQVAPTPPPPPSSASPVDESLVMRTQSGLALHMHPEVWGRWSMTDYAAIKVRSKEYVQSGVKIPPPCPPTMEIIQLEIWQCEKQVYHVCSYKDNWLRKFKAAQAAAGAGKPRVSPQPSSSPSRSSSPPSASSNASSASSASSSSSSAPRDLSSGAGLRPFDDDFFFVAHFCVQTNPTYHLTMYFQRREVARANGQQQAAASPPAASASASASPSSPSSPTLFFDEEKHEPRAAAAAKQSFDTLFSRFINASTEWRNSRLKLIPFVVDGGNWFVQKTVGQRPAIIGRKIDTKYYCDPELNYMEVDIDVTSSKIGSGIFRVVKGYAAYLTLDLTLLIEGQQPDELPEVILGGCRLAKLDLSRPEFRPPPKK